MLLSPETGTAARFTARAFDQFNRTMRGLSIAEGFAGHVEALARSQGWRAAMDVWIGLLERTNRWEGAAQQWMAMLDGSGAELVSTAR